MKWEPIDTAPKDGTDICLAKFEWVKRPHKTERECVSEYAIASYHRGTWGTYLSDDYYGQCLFEEPTHWMPLPAPPLTPAE